MGKHRATITQRLLHALGLCPRARGGYRCPSIDRCGWRS